VTPNALDSLSTNNRCPASFHSLALGAAVLARRRHARTSEVCIRSALAVAIPFLLASDQRRVIQDGILDTGEKRFRAKRDTFQCGSQSGNRGRGR
jgi:hypothetical protein